MGQALTSSRRAVAIACAQEDLVYLRAQLTELAQRHGLAMLSTPRNDISMGTQLFLAVYVNQKLSAYCRPPSSRLRACSLVTGRAGAAPG